ncbi:MAG TPA: serine/threonine-protein kinase [Candidatus Sulfotelmatobacter sp.]|nr:serine/threonine-protein kinase [Candidatus Sulfotelmatobacter sp.]
MENAETKRFGRYEIVTELGRGAMGVVYKARDPQIDRIVAIKTVSLWRQEAEEEQEFRLRFLNEAQAAGRLHHSGIVSIFDVGESPENGDPYIVLEYVSGESLSRILGREKKLPLATALQLAQEVAEALDYAHAQGVVHRDIKPANILVTETGHAKIADFGIAKLNLAHFTLPGRVLGTPAYMAPEQLSGEGVDGRSDLFSLGVILYAMVTGHSAFQGSSATTVCFKVANREPVAASALDMTLPPQLDAVISRAIAKNPDERYQRGTDLAEDLRILQQNYKPGSTTTSLQAITGLGLRPAGSRTGSTTSALRPVAAVADAQQVVRYAMLKAPIRDLVIGAAVMVLLVILAAQTKLLVITPPKMSVTPPSISIPTGERAKSTSAMESTQADTPMPPPVPMRAHKKAHIRNVHSPAKQIVVASATLDVAVQHQFKDATLFLWVDDKLSWTRALHGGAQKKLVVFSGVRGVESESLQIPAGAHVLRFRVVSADHTTDLSKTVSAEFIGGDTKTLQLTFDKHNTMMRVNWQ